MYILAGVLLVSVLVLLFGFLVLHKTKKKGTIKTKHGSGKNAWYTAYLFFNKSFLTRKYIAAIRKRFEILDISDKWTIGKNTMKFSAITLLSGIVVFLVLALSGKDLYSVIVGSLMGYLVHNQILSIFVYSVENKIFHQFEKFLGDVRHHYHEHGMIDEAVFDSVEDCSYEMGLHAHKIHEILISNNMEEEIEKYNDVAPNKFFKTFLALSQTVLKFDDKQVDNKSVFLTNLNYLKQEVNVEILKRQKLSYLFKSLSMISVIPIFMLKPIEKWASGNIPELAGHYQGSYGFIGQIVIFAAVLLSYQLINRLQSNEQESPILSEFEDRVLKVKPIANIVDVFIRANYSKALKYGEILKSTGSRASVKAFYLKRIGYMILAFALSLFICINVYNINQYNILNGVGQIGETQEIEKALLLKYKDVGATYEQIRGDVMAFEGVKDELLVATTAERIQKNIIAYNNQFFRWWQLIICFALSIFAYQLPYWILLFRMKILQMEMEDEVIQFHAIILMLMHIERISVENILQWMDQFAVIFKSSISKCINNFEHGDVEALDQLMIDEPFMPFTRLVENLQAASDKISVRQAFDALVIERGYYQDKRKQDNEIMIAKKALYGNFLAFTPLAMTFFLHLLLPFMIYSINQLFSYSEQIKNLL